MKADQETMQRLLEIEQKKVRDLQSQLQNTLKQNELEKDELIEHIASAHAAEVQYKETQMKRLNEKNAKLTRCLMREQAIVSDFELSIYRKKIWPREQGIRIQLN